MIQKFRTSDLQAFLDNLGCKLIHAVVNGTVEDMVGSSTLIERGTVLANMLDAPISKLAVRENVYLC